MDDIEVDIEQVYPPVGESTGRSQGRKDPLAAELHRTLGRRPFRQEVPRTKTPRGDPAAEVGTSRRSGRNRCNVCRSLAAISQGAPRRALLSGRASPARCDG